jgi:hypothetical protein
VATQDPDRQGALVVPDKADRVESFHKNTLHAFKELLQAAGLTHPQELRAHHIVRRVSPNEVRLLSDLLGYLEEGDLLVGKTLQPVFERFWSDARADSFALGGQHSTRAARPVMWLTPATT